MTAHGGKTRLLGPEFSKLVLHQLEVSKIPIPTEFWTVDKDQFAAFDQKGTHVLVEPLAHS